LSEEIAEITWNPKTMRISNAVFSRNSLRFNCRQCAIFCCRLGGPKVHWKDVERIKQAGHETVDFLDPSSNEEDGRGGVLSRKQDGSCVFLQPDIEAGKYRCGVYAARPALCQLYPFEFEQTGVNQGVLKFIPCCNGLNARDSFLVNKGFIEKHLLKAIAELF